MIKVIDRDLWEGVHKVGWLEENHIFDEDGKKVGYYSGNDIFDATGRKIGYMANNHLCTMEGHTIDEDELIKEVSGEELNDVARGAIRLLIGG